MGDNFKIGAGLKIDGEAEFKRAVTGINKDLSVLGSEMKKVTAQFDGNADSMESLTAKQKVYNDRADEQRKKIEVMTAALESAKKEFGENSDKVKDWQIKLNNAEADLAKTESALNKTTKQIDGFGKEAEDSGSEVEKAGKQARDSGDDARKGEGGWSKLSGVLGGIAAAAGAAVAGLATAAAGVAVGAVKAASKAAIAGADYADNVNTIATQTGLTTDEVQQLQYQADMVDVSLETVTGSMAKLTRNMATAQGGTGDAAKAFAALGISVTDSKGELRNNQDVFNEAIDALGKMENETQRDAYAMQIFGKSAQELNPLIRAGSETLNQFAQDAKDSGYVLGTEALTALNDYQDSIDRIAKQKDALSNAIGVLAAPAFNVFTDSTDDALKALTKLINGDISAEDFAEEIGAAVQKISEYITGALPKLMEVGGTILKTIIDAIVINLPMLLNAAVPMITSLLNAIVQALPTLITAAIPILQALISGIVQALPLLIPAAVSLLLAITQGILDNLPMIVEAAMTLIITLAQGVADALPELIPVVIDTVLMIVETLLDNMDLILDAAFKIIEGLAEGLLNALPKLVDALPKIIKSIIDFVTNNLPKIIEMGITLIVQLAVGLVKAIPALVRAIPEIIAAILNGLGNAVGSVLEIGKNIVKGLWEGIKSMVTWIEDKVSGFIGGIVDGVKGFLGIGSPSKVFMAIGDNMGESLGMGFTSAMADASKQIDKSIPTDFNVSARNGATQVKHSGVIRVEGVNDGGQLIGIAEVAVEEALTNIMRKQVRMA